MSYRGARKVSKGAKDPLNKKIPKNPKYKNVKSRLDTGYSVSKAKEREEYVKTHFKYQKDERFRRLKANTLAQLILEVEDSSMDGDDLDSSEFADLDEAATMDAAMHPSHQPMARGQYPPGYGSRTTPVDDARSTATMASTTSSFYSVITGMGELQAPERRTAVYDTSSPYLLVDVRDEDDFRRSQIVGAVSFPHTRLSRATNVLTKPLQAYKNLEGSIIIVYDEDESIAPRVATWLVQHDVSNIFMLSGGMRVLLEKFPEGLVLGEIPASCRPKSRQKSLSSQYAPVTLGKLTKANLEVVRGQLEENLLLSETASLASTARTSRTKRTTATARSTATASTTTSTRTARPTKIKPRTANTRQAPRSSSSEAARQSMGQPTYRNTAPQHRVASTSSTSSTRAVAEARPAPPRGTRASPRLDTATSSTSSLSSTQRGGVRHTSSRSTLPNRW